MILLLGFLIVGAVKEDMRNQEEIHKRKQDASD
jgi:hypothetical protein